MNRPQEALYMSRCDGSGHPVYPYILQRDAVEGLLEKYYKLDGRVWDICYGKALNVIGCYDELKDYIRLRY